MRSQRALALAAAAAGIVVFAALVASYAIARTPGDAIHASPRAAITPAPPGEEVAYTLPANRSARDIGADLQKLGIISSGDRFSLLVKLMGVDEKLSKGDYILNKDMPTAAAVEAVTVKEQVPVLRVTFPEGIRIEEMAVRAEQAKFCTRQQFLDAVNQEKLPPEFAATLPPGANLEGYLFPDTYILPVGAGCPGLVDRMIKTFTTKFSPALVAAAAAKGLNPHQAITLASIIEREAVIESERPLIAGVFLNRLANGDLLGADPTVQFVVAQDPTSVQRYGWWKKELTLDDLKVNSPYNTRLVPGLPPGPITNPGLASIEAVANATPTKFYYFVADAKKGDGSHVFAETFAQHEANIAAVGSP
ncbi:MAG: endolytic transglycosylase MltG [Chloroflexi bacterium]|nr:endolytic transglycosylase MltG [Chloroflexota bacterium]